MANNKFQTKTLFAYAGVAAGASRASRASRSAKYGGALWMGAKLILALFSLALLAGCSDGPYDKYVGYWKRAKDHHDGMPVVMQIKKEGGTYIAVTDIAATDESADISRQDTDLNITRVAEMTEDKKKGILVFQMPLFGALPFVLSDDAEKLRMGFDDAGSFQRNYTRISESEAEKLKEETIAFLQKSKE